MRARKVSEHLESVVQRHGGKTLPCGLVLPAKLPFEALKNIANALIAVDETSAWAWGDWWRSSEHRHGERRKLVNSENWRGPAYQTLANRGSVAEAFSKISRRRYNLTFTHHATVSSLPPAKADKILAEAAAHSYSVRWVEDAVRRLSFDRADRPGLAAIQSRQDDTRTLLPARKFIFTRERAVVGRASRTTARPTQSAGEWSRATMAKNELERAIDQVTHAVRDALRTPQMTPTTAMASIAMIIDQILTANTIDALLRAKLQRLRQALSADVSDVEEPAA